MTARKDDSTKLRFSLMPHEALREVLRALEHGARKYGEQNWRKGMKWTRNLDASYRHLSSFLTGEDIDPDSGLNHLAHVICDCLFVLSYWINHVGEDDRHKLSNSLTWSSTMSSCSDVETTQQVMPPVEAPPLEPWVIYTKHGVLKCSGCGSVLGGFRMLENRAPRKARRKKVARRKVSKKTARKAKRKTRRK